MSTGSHHQQTYWIPIPGAQGLMQLGWSYLLDEQRWTPARGPVPDSTLEGSHARGLWSFLCIRCHATAGRIARPDAPANIAAEVAELGIACEACHGPGAAHVARTAIRCAATGCTGAGATARDGPIRQTRAKLPHDRSAMVCGRCHSVAELKSQPEWWKTWRRLHARRRPLPRPATCWRGRSARATTRGRSGPDGTYKPVGREFSGLLVSRCYTQGELSCVSCHSMARE